ncbi:type II/IV secretion system ATPase subunit [Halorubrum pallidum]|uniref:Type II/IV secretion system ATPase subunit n=1 Tax=Halorubrum pallidum TaxID=1526114 RepID=A0ABD5T1P7_9EURY
MSDTNYPDPIHGAQVPSRSSDADELDREAFFTTPDGLPTIATGADLQLSVPPEDRGSIEEITRYWAVFPYSYVSICRSRDNGEVQYYVAEPFLSEPERKLTQFIFEKVDGSLRSESTQLADEDGQIQRSDLRTRVFRVLERYDLFDTAPLRAAHNESDVPELRSDEESVSRLQSLLHELFNSEDSDPSEDIEAEHEYEYSGPDGREYGATTGRDYLPVIDQIEGHPAYRTTPGWGDADNGDDTATDGGQQLVGVDEDGGAPSEVDERVDASPATGDEAALTVDELRDAALGASKDATLSTYHVYKILYYVEREIIGFGQIDAIKNDQNVEDISCNGYNEPVFVYHTQHQQIRTNLSHGREELDRYVKSLAQFAGKELSRRTPEVDAKIPDGSRAQLSLGSEVSDDGTNYTIRQFKNVPYTPIDLLNWGTYSLDQLALLWLATENELSTLIAGGTGAGKTTTLNALSLFLPSSNKIVSIEDTQEITLPHRNWTKKLTREAGDQMDESASIDEYDLLESAFRMRPDHIIMGEVRGNEGQDLLQGMSSGHAGITTFHADTVPQVIHRFTTEPINASKTLFTALDLIIVQRETQVDGRQVRRNNEIAEVRGFDPTEGSIAIEPIYQRNSVTDSYEKLAEPDALTHVRKRRGWSEDELEAELEKRRVVLSALSLGGITAYRDVASVVQSFIQDEEAVLSAIADGSLREQLERFGQLRNVKIEATQTDEKTLERPGPGAELREELEQTIEESEVV